MWLAAAFLFFALTCDGIYHVRHACLSIVAKAGRDGTYGVVSSNIVLPLGIATMPTYVGFVALDVAVLLGQMVFLACLAVLTPVTTSLLGYVQATRAAACTSCAPRLAFAFATMVSGAGQHATFTLYRLRPAVGSDASFATKAASGMVPVVPGRHSGIVAGFLCRCAIISSVVAIKLTISNIVMSGIGKRGKTCALPSKTSG